ncbi:hypothetical protein pVco7_gp007 [Vibrio phage pVco-7]|uniref:Uncharacterized protein n=1 Tax=Vibrio phage pVco-5 TaxID=1965485 RepID=A0A1W6JUR3_9CAUD|nr:hypothetical protein KNT61_gp008 [Vibrio phage pVco-5]ARM70996.1 hypothetical protein pVco5_008 [Vibrio phage pVco-5]
MHLLTSYIQTSANRNSSYPYTAIIYREQVYFNYDRIKRVGNKCGTTWDKYWKPYDLNTNSKGNTI